MFKNTLKKEESGLRKSRWLAIASGGVVLLGAFMQYSRELLALVASCQKSLLNSLSS